MQNNFDTVKETLQQQVKLLTSDITRWTAFLNAAGNNYKYPFKDQVMIFDRKPNAVACATIDFWNKHERLVNKGTKGIPLLDDTKNTLKYIFDVSDTNSKANKGIYLWQAEENYYDSILESLEDSFGDLPVHINFFNDIRKIASKVFEKKLELIAIEKAKNLMHNKNNKLGGIEYGTINDTRRANENDGRQDRGGNPVNESSTQSNRRTDGRNLSSGERLLYPTMGGGSGTGGSSKPDNTVYENEEQIPGRTSGDTIYNNVDGRNTSTTSEGDRQTGLRDGGTSDKTDDEGTGRNRTAQSRGSDEVGGNDEQHPLLREGDNSERDNLRIIENKLPTVEKQIENIEEKAEDKTSAFVISGKILTQYYSVVVVFTVANTEYLNSFKKSNPVTRMLLS